MKKGLYILVIILSISQANTQNNNTIFEQANTLYNKGKYTEAIDKYTAILETKNHSPELYYNLANAHYKLNNVGPSIYYYEKALQLSPNNDDVKNNLNYAKNMTVDAIGIIPEVGFSKVIKNVSNTMSFDAWAKIAVLLVFCFVILFLIYYFSYSTIKKRISFVSSLVCLLFLVITLALAFNKYAIDKKNNPAIVFVQETKIKTEPNLRSEEAFRLHEGTKVQILEAVDNWKKIKLNDGKMGWVVSDDIKMLNN